MVIFKIIQSWFRAIKLWIKRLDIEFTAEITATNKNTGERKKFVGKSNIEEVALWKAMRKANKHAKKAR
jgi:hypothetical protein